MPDFTLEQSGIVCGVDEAGRGPLAGPVIAACVFIPLDIRTDKIWKQVKDSKKLSASKRDELFNFIIENSKYGIGFANVVEIDQFNILQATFIAMKRAYAAMDFECELALIDGNQSPPFPIPTRTVIKGDDISTSIAAASILAKVTRDRVMHDLHQKYPQFGWDSNAGYGTAHHMAALAQHGACPEHRQSFAPVARLKSA